VRAIGYNVALTARKPRIPLHRLSLKAAALSTPADSSWTWSAPARGPAACLPRLSRCAPLWRGQKTGMGTRSALVCVPRVVYHDAANDRFAAAEWVLLHVLCSNAAHELRTK
jgi:hypothetical protein